MIEYFRDLVTTKSAFRGLLLGAGGLLVGPEGAGMDIPGWIGPLLLLLGGGVSSPRKQ